MSTAGICRLLLERNRATLAEIADSIYSTEAVTRAALAKLLGDGILSLDKNLYAVKDKASAEIIAGVALSKSLEFRESYAAIEAARKRTPAALVVDLAGAEIEDDVPIPAKGRRDLDKRYPFARMAVGQSFALQTPEGTKPNVFRQRIVNAAMRFRRRNPLFRFVTCAYADGLVRFWREPDSEIPPTTKAGEPGKAAA